MDSPKIPDPNQAAIAGAQADLQNFPFEYQIDALAKMGGKATIGGKTYDFTGLGDADNASAVSDKMAQALLDIQKNYGSDFVKQRLADLQQSDPNGYAARKQLFDKILADADKNPDRPLAQDTQNQIMQLLQQGGQLTTGPNSETEQVQQGVRGQQLRNGIFLGNAPASAEASAIEQAGEQKRTQNQQQAINFQTSGVSPEDVEYRRIQQSLSNLGAAINGTTPEAQFGSLTSAGNGAAPFTSTGGINVSTNPNAGLLGIQGANAIYAGNVNWNNSQVNPFISGLQGGLGTLQTASALGWNPSASFNPGIAVGQQNAWAASNPSTEAEGWG
jgi:hypothetical protein